MFGVGTLPQHLVQGADDQTAGQAAIDGGKAKTDPGKAWCGRSRVCEPVNLPTQTFDFRQRRRFRSSTIHIRPPPSYVTMRTYSEQTAVGGSRMFLPGMEKQRWLG